jgi:hypothetical protein
MNRARAVAGLDGVQLVLVCQGCRYAWEPTASTFTPEQLRPLAGGCPQCGDWLFLGELADSIRTPRRANP